MPLYTHTGNPYGNACEIAMHTEAGLPTVDFTADPHGGTEALWFCFRVTQTGIPERGMLRLRLNQCSNLLGWDAHEVVRPVWKVDTGDWERLGPGMLETLHDGRVRVSWLVDVPDSQADFAFCYPYGRHELEDLS